MNWGILGIQPTSDKKQITQAYRAALVHVNPEDKPEEFKALRAAYEEALELAKKQQAVQDDPVTPIDHWIRRVSQAYNHFPSRISADVWRGLLQDEVCVALDTRPQAEEALLRFLMEDYRLPGCVWKVIDQEFSWLERAAELKESYPSDFVEYIIVNGTVYGEFLPYDLFNPGQDANDCDEYITLFTQTRRDDMEGVTETVGKLRMLSESHPYGQALILSVDARGGDTQAIEDMEALTQEFPCHEYVITTVVMTMVELQEFERGERICRAFLENDQSNNVSLNLARCLAGQGEYVKGIETLNDIMARVGGDDIALNTLNELRVEWNGHLVEGYERTVRENPDDSETRFELAWCYLQTDRVDESWEVARLIDPEKIDPFKYTNLISQIHFAAKRYEEGLAVNDEVIQVIRSYGEGKDEEEKKRVARLVEKLMLRASILQLLERRDEAAQEFESALALDPDNPNHLNRIARFYLVTHDFQRARDHAWHLTQVLPGAYHGYLTLAYAAFGLHDDREAFEAVNRAIDEDGTDLSEYTLKLQILIRNGAFQEAEALLDFLTQNGAGEAAGVKFALGQLAEIKERDFQKACNLYEQAALKVEDDEYTYDPAQIFLRWAVSTGQLLDMSQDENLHCVLDLLERGLKQDEYHLGCMDYKVWILQKLGKNNDALEVLQAMEKDPQHDDDVERQLAEMYRKDMRHRADKALACYQKLLKDEPKNEVYLFYAGICLTNLNCFEEAEQLFLREEEVEPDNVDPHRSLYRVYLALGRYQEALSRIDRCIEIYTAEGKSLERFLRERVRVLRRMGRYEEAISTAQNLAQYDLRAAHQLIFDMYVQSGNFEGAKAYLKGKGVKLQGAKNMPENAYMLFLLTFLQQKFVKAQLTYLDRQASMGEDDRLEGRILLDSLEGKYGKEIAKWYERLQAMASVDYDGLSHACMNLALAFWRSGDSQSARDYAAQGLDACIGGLKEFTLYRPLYLTRQAVMLAVLGRFDEAYECLNRARGLSLCDHCPYCACKDADLFETIILSMKGQDEQAVSLCDQYLEKWPDEEDFIVQKRYSEKRI